MGHTHGVLGPWSLGGALFVVTQLASANPQFEHVASSEWWVEMRIAGEANPTAVTATPEGTAPVALTPSSHGTWFASFYVPADSLLTFDAYYADGQRVSSSPFLWPAGQPVTPTTTMPVASQASFFDLVGNSWWVETYVDSALPVLAVEASVDQLEWRPLTPTAWGSHAASFYVPDGALVRFRAQHGEESTSVSGAFRWPEVMPVDEPAVVPLEPLPPPSTTGAQTVTFGDVRGNTWWLEVSVDVPAGATLRTVEHCVGSSECTSLSSTSWGPWVGPTFAPPGSSVTFRATDTNGQVSTSNPYGMDAAGRWTSLAAAEGPPAAPPSEPPSKELLNVEVWHELDDPRVVTLGRVDRRIAGSPACGWTGCGVLFTTDAKRAELEVEARLYAAGEDWLYLEVEGLGTRAIRLSHGFQRIVLFETSDSKPRRVRVQKRTEPQVGTVVFAALRLESGSLLATAPSMGPRLLIVGDSITAGYGNIGVGPQCYFTPATEAGELSWGHLVAQQLGGEALITAFSGKGVYRNRDVSDPATMPILYNRVDAFDETSVEAYPKVDAVLVNLGTNDFAFSNPPAEAFIASYTAYAAALRKSFPGAPILLISGPMITDEYPAGNAARTTLRQHLEAVVSRRWQSGDSNISFLELAVQDTNGPLGCDYHPHEQVHRAMATTISDELHARLGN